MRTKPYATSVLVFDEVELLDVTGPISLLTAAGRQWNFQPFKIELVAAELGRVATRSGIALEPSRTFATPFDVECLIIPGGYGARKATQQQAVVDWVSRAASTAQFVLVIGNGALLAARAGLLANAEVSCLPELADELRSMAPGARVNVDSSVCESGQLLSTARSALGLDLACELVARTFGKKLASSLSSALGVGWAGELEVLEIVGV